MVRVQNMERNEGSGPRRAMGLIPSERAPKTMVTHVEIELFHGFHVEISWVKGGLLVEDGVLGNLAPPGDLEESASHHIMKT